MVTSASYCAGPSLAHRILFGSTARSPAPFPAPGRSGSPATSTGFPVSRRPRGGAGGRGGLTGEIAKRVPQGVEGPVGSRHVAHAGGPRCSSSSSSSGWARRAISAVPAAGRRAATADRFHGGGARPPPPTRPYDEAAHDGPSESSLPPSRSRSGRSLRTSTQRMATSMQH
ncbi:hypothetical protein BHE74_00035578 [Ensete ventricosum]|nr:hypothetical protein BHE74_00035578 [Ensete ventricosum]